MLDYSTAYQFTDVVDRTNPFDSEQICYILDTPTVNRLRFIDLNDFVGGSTFSRDIGVIPFNWPLAERFIMVININRHAAASRSYFSAIATSLQSNDGFFSSRPQLIPGNFVLEEDGVAEGAPVLGYFGVRDRDVLYIDLSTEEIRALAGGRRCPRSTPSESLPPLCRYCFQDPLASTVKPPFFP